MVRTSGCQEGRRHRGHRLLTRASSGAGAGTSAAPPPVWPQCWAWTQKLWASNWLQLPTIFPTSREALPLSGIQFLIPTVGPITQRLLHTAKKLPTPSTSKDTGQKGLLVKAEAIGPPLPFPVHMRPFVFLPCSYMTFEFKVSN